LSKGQPRILILMNSTISRQTVQAYRDARYRVCATPPWVMRVDCASPELLAAQRQHGAGCSAFVTACNPLGRIGDVAANRLRRRELRQEIERLGLQTLPGVGGSADGEWPDEESDLVFGLDLAGARLLGRRFRQNAVLWSGPEGIPRLILLR
jgi:hypothetical protein